MKLSLPARLCSCVLLIGAAVPFAQEAPPAFRTRVADFWSGFAEHADEYRKALLAGTPGEIGQVKQALDARLAEFLPGLRFAADIGQTPETVRIDLLPGDDRTRQLLGRELAAAMPQIAGWECVTWRPPADPSRSIGKIGTTNLLPRDFRVACEWNGETQLLSLAVWHAGFSKLKQADQQTLATRFVDRALGAAMLKRTPHTTSVLESQPDADAEGIVAGDVLYTTLVEFLKSEAFDAATAPDLVEEYFGPPSGEYSADTRLGDLQSGASRYMDLVAEFNLDMGTSTLERLDKFGAGAGYIGFSHTLERVPFDPDSGLAWIALRQEVAQSLDAQLIAAHAGTVVGFGDGAARLWIDVLFFDEQAALPILRACFAADARVTSAELYAFDRSKLGPRAKLK